MEYYDDVVLTKEPPKLSMVDTLMSRKAVQFAPPVPTKTIKLDVSKLTLTDDQIMRQRIIHELLVTEREYVFDLQIISELFAKPVKERKLMSAGDQRRIFSALEDFYQHNQVFYRALFD